MEIRYCLENQPEKAKLGSNGVLFFKTPKAMCNNFRIAAQTICIEVLPLFSKRLANSLQFDYVAWRQSPENTTLYGFVHCRSWKDSSASNCCPILSFLASLRQRRRLRGLTHSAKSQFRSTTVARSFRRCPECFAIIPVAISSPGFGPDGRRYWPRGQQSPAPGCESFWQYLVWSWLEKPPGDFSPLAASLARLRCAE